MKKVFAMLLAVMMLFGAVSALAEKAPEEYSGTLTIYSPHDADPLNAGVQGFEAKYPNVKVEIVADGTGNLLNRIKAESAAPEADILWGGGADSNSPYSSTASFFFASCKRHASTLNVSAFHAIN